MIFKEWIDTIDEPNSFSLDLGYDLVGNVDTLTQKVDSDLDGTLNDESWYGHNFAYDELNRLKSGAATASPAVSVGYKYDLSGNILGLNRGIAGVPATSYFYYANSNRLDYVSSLGQSSGNYQYDGNGNLVRDIEKGISSDILYTFRNLPYEITLPTSFRLQFGYDGNGNRIIKNYQSQ